jgi:hypothetical protein
MAAGSSGKTTASGAAPLVNTPSSVGTDVGPTVSLRQP